MSGSKAKNLAWKKSDHFDFLGKCRRFPLNQAAIHLISRLHCEKNKINNLPCGKQYLCEQ